MEPEYKTYTVSLEEFVTVEDDGENLSESDIIERAMQEIADNGRNLHWLVEEQP